MYYEELGLWIWNICSYYVDILFSSLDVFVDIIVFLKFIFLFEENEFGGGVCIKDFLVY